MRNQSCFGIRISWKIFLGDDASHVHYPMMEGHKVASKG